jgi:hypothetical protein
MNGVRKFWLSVGVIVLSAGMVFADKLAEGGWVTIATLALTIYAGANVIDKMKGGAG